MSQDDQALLDRFVQRFTVDEWDTYGQQNQKIVSYQTPADALQPLYAVLPGPFPPLYEQFLLSYRWPEVELPALILLANPFGAGLTGLLDRMRRDKTLWDVLTPRGFLPFARAGGGNYDPVCFDTRRRHKSGDAPIVRLDHEQILCNRRIRIVGEVAGSFRDLVQTSIEKSQDART